MTAMGEKSVSLSRRRWVRILNLLTEELQVWETTDPVYREVQETILMIEGQTGIRKKQPSKYDIADPKERERLLWELSGYLADDKEAGRKAFLQDGTDLPGRKFALDALDELRRALPFSQRKPSGVYDPEKEIIATGFESFELMEKSRKAINTSTKKGKAKPRPKEWTEKDEDALESLVHEIFRACGPQAVSDTRKACETGEKALREADRDG